MLIQCNYSVYQRVDKQGVVIYWLTRRLSGIRFGEHLNSIGTGKEFLRYEVVPGANNLSKTAARIWEQSIINKYGLFNQGQLLNRINSIAPKYWWQYGLR